MPEIFIDTSAWYPAVVASHPEHAAVAQSMQEAVRAGARLVTTNLVVIETHALLLHRVGRAVALTFAQTVYEPPTLVVTSTAELEQHAITEWIARYADQSLSLADAVSFAVMKARGIPRALTLDTHFATAGFTMVPNAVPSSRRKRTPGR